MSFFYVYAHQWTRFQARKLSPYTHDANDIWENIRYLLETEMNMHNRKNAQFIIGKYVNDYKVESCHDFKQVQDWTFIHPHDFIVLIRKPKPYYLKSYTPSKYSTDYSTCKSELDKLNTVLESAKLAFKNKRHEHPSKWNNCIPTWYHCYKCGAIGAHGTPDCENPITNFKHYKKRGNINGIPRSSLMHANPTEININTMIDNEGQHWVYKDNLNR